jgi:transposase-like protein
VRVEILNGVERRRRWSEDEKARIIEESFASGTKVSDVARKYGVSRGPIFAWPKEARVDGYASLDPCFIAMVIPNQNLPDELESLKRLLAAEQIARIDAEAKATRIVADVSSAEALIGHLNSRSRSCGGSSMAEARNAAASLSTAKCWISWSSHWKSSKRRHRPVSVKELARSLPRKAWRRITWREGSNAPLTSRFAALRVRPASHDEKRTVPHPLEWLLAEG